jgi:hypothetical protein
VSRIGFLFTVGFFMPYKDQEKQKEAQRLWIARRKASYLAGEVCSCCGETRSLQVIKRSNEKIKKANALFSCKAYEEKLSNFIVLCEACADPYKKAKASQRRLAGPARHGTYYRYRQGCRCEPCSTAQAQAYQRRREKELAAKDAAR